MSVSVLWVKVNAEKEHTKEKMTEMTLFLLLG